jgi:hypothetical protein
MLVRKTCGSDHTQRAKKKAVESPLKSTSPFCASHLFLTSLRTTPKALLQLVRDRWSIEGWHWIRNPPAL